MDKKTAAIIFTVVATVSAATWVIRSEIATNAAADDCNLIVICIVGVMLSF